ncbi:kinase domain protein (macronuclear) [Tetrahymena thermophila SB210]|uniref:Kinase domain protein n=1 Tax=Tetrahymena thermophila (strain SB210) TaxID=312017 RepID=I7LUM3_TETTS|nr:kinase domain protein [Tetrahymena thermophila SB210]EAR94959.1 kinase domain protein [Tetrahymena thermophila SB210]|eukprot:XP_001015204.1 kinase domain protein [Tetrahymena thermophila SB210]
MDQSSEIKDIDFSQQPSITHQKSKQNSIKIQPKDFIFKNQKHFLEVYEIDKNGQLGQGGHASIYKLNEMSHDNGKNSSRKCAKKFEKKNLFFKNSEIQSLKSLDHPNIVKLYEYFEERDAFYIIMEEVQGRDLFDEMAERKRPFGENDTCQIIQQVLQALSYTHQKGIIHRDIKLENIMVSQNHIQTANTYVQATNSIDQQEKCQGTEQSQNIERSLEENQNQFNTNSILNNKEDSKGQSQDTKYHTTEDQQIKLNSQNQLSQDDSQIEWRVKLIDWSFGTNRSQSKTKFLSSLCGSLMFQAPEYFDKKYTEKIDIWALGVVMYTMLANRYPFGQNCKSKLQIQTQIQKEQVVFGKEWDTISDEAKDLINKMLEKNPEKRPSAQELLNHVWFKIHKTNKTIIQDTQQLKNNLRNLKQFKCQNEFQKAILTFISVNLVSSQDKIELENLFKRLDTNQDGRLSKEEIMNGFNQIWHNDYMTEEQINLIFDQVDSDKSDSIDYSEFITATLERKTFNEKEYLQKAFNLFDQDGDGHITKDEILKIIGNADDYEQTSEIEQQIQQIIQQIDINQDGKIQFEEFCSIIQQFTNQEIQMSQ